MEKYNRIANDVRKKILEGVYQQMSNYLLKKTFVNFTMLVK